MMKPGNLIYKHHIPLKEKEYLSLEWRGSARTLAACCLVSLTELKQ